MTNAHALQSVEELTKPGGALDIGRDPARLLVLLIRLLAQRGGPLPNQEAGGRSSSSASTSRRRGSSSRGGPSATLTATSSGSA